MLHWQTQEEPWLEVDDQVVMDMCHDRAIRIHVPADGVGHQREAHVTAAVATRIHDAAKTSGVELSIGIITPFRTQINAIRASLSPMLRDVITVDTVERYQGSERDVIIYSAAVTSPTDIDALSSVAATVFGTIDRKLNVAVSRARQQFILIGDTELLLGSSHYAALIQRLTPIPAENIVD
jgi:DNA replication ATP-dependent helicase Dna2